MTTTDPGRMLVAAVEAEATALQRIADALVSLIRHLFGAMDNPYDRAQVATFVRTSGQAVLSARRQTAGISDAYVRYVLDVLALPPTRSPEPIADLPRGIPLGTEWVRPVKEYRRARLTGLDELEAADRAARRAETMARMDLATAARDARANRLAVAEDVIGWRRIIHPEESRGGTCGLCIAAADRLYSTDVLPALHDRCHCTVAPVTRAHDPGLNLNRDSLNRLYSVAGGTGRQELAKVRMGVRMHGELGPVLVDDRDHFRGPGQVAKDAGQLAEAVATELGVMRDYLASLERRATAGEDVSGPLQWQRDRIAAMEQLASAA